MGGRWGGGPLAQRQTHCVFNEIQKQQHSVRTCQAKTVISSSLTPHAPLLVHPSGTVASYIATL